MSDNKYEKGSILKFDNEKIDTVIVLGEYNKNNEHYVLVSPYKDIGNDTVVTDNSKLLLLKISENDDIFIETDEKIVKPILIDILNNAT